MRIALALAFIACSSLSLASEVGNYPNAGTLTGTERFLVDQGGPAGPSTNGTTVNVTPSQIQNFIFPSGYLPASLMPILSGDCSTSNGSYVITCTKSNGTPFSPLATTPNSTEIVALFSGCTGIEYLGADGACHPPGVVTSVGLSMPNAFTVTGSPVTSSGTLAVTLASQTANQAWLSPNGAAGPPVFRSIATADLPLIPLASGVSGILPTTNGGSGEGGSITGLLKANGTSPFTTAASTDVTNLWAGSCTSSTYLRGDGSCQTPAGTGGTVSSVGLVAPSSIFAVSGSPVSTTGTLTLTFASGQTTHQVVGTGSSGTVGLESLTATDLPAIPLSTGVTGVLSAANGGTGEAGTVSGILVGNGSAAHTAATSANVISLWSGSCSSSSFLRGDGACQAGIGTVTSVGLIDGSSSPIFTITGSPVINSGNLTETLATEAANKVFAGPATGSAVQPTFRSLVANDIPTIPLGSGVSGVLSASLGGTGETGTLTGITKANGTSAFSAAASSDVTTLFSGTCSSSTFLRGDGQCQTPPAGAGFQVNGIGLASSTTINYQNSAATNGLTITVANPSAGNVQMGISGWPSLVSGDCLSNNGSTLSWITCSTAFSAITSGTNATALTMGSGGTLTTSGSGVINANELNSATIPASAALLASNASSQATAVTLGNTFSIASGALTTSLPINPQAGTSYTIAATDLGKLVTFTNAASIAASLPQAGTTGFGAGFYFRDENKGASVETLTPTTSTINGSASLSIPGGTGCTVASDGTNYQVSDCTALVPGTVTSVAATVPGFLSISGSPIISNGTLAISYSGTALPVANGGSGATTLTGPIKGNGTAAFSAASSSDIYGLWSGTCSSSTFLRGDGSCQTPPAGAGFQVNGISLTSSSIVNFESSSAFNGLTATFANPSSGNVQLGFSGSLNLAGLSAQAANTLVANATGSSAAPTAVTVGGNLAFVSGVLQTTQPLNAQTGTSYAFLASDAGKLVTFNNASAVAATLSAATTTGFTAGYAFDVQNPGAGTVTITPTTSTINGSSSLAIPQNTGCTVTSDGTNYQVSACTAIGGTTKTIASGTSALGTSAISSGACATAVTTSASGVATTDAITWSFNADPTSTTGYSPSSNGMLTIISYPTSGNVNWKVCNNTASSITPGAVTLNWRVVR